MEPKAFPAGCADSGVQGVLVVPDPASPERTAVHLVLSTKAAPASPAPVFEGSLGDFAAAHYPLRSYPGDFVFLSSRDNGPVPEGRVRIVAAPGGEARTAEGLEPLLYGVWHDLQNSLVAVQGYASLLASPEPQDPGRKSAYLERIEVNAGMLEGLLDTLGRVLRSGSLAGPQREVELVGVLERAAGELRTLPGEGPEVEIEGPLPVVWADPVSLYQIFSNLLWNAWEYRHPERPCRVTVHAATRGRELLVSVTDNGLGIPEGEEEGIFQVHRRQEGNGRRHGIGLYTVRRLVEAHDGRIWAAHAPGGGAAIRFTLPAAPQMGLPFAPFGTGGEREGR